MKLSWNLTALRNQLLLLTLVLGASLLVSPMSLAQDEDAGDKSDEKAQAEDEEEPDPFMVPEGDNDELKAFILKMVRYRAPVKSREEAIELLKNRMNAIATAAEKIAATEPEEEMLVFAIENQFAALESLVRYDRSQTERLDKLIEKVEGHAVPAIAKLPEASQLRQRVQMARTMEVEELEGVAEEVLAYIEKYGADPAGASLATMLGRYMGYAGATETGAVFYERVGQAMEKSDNPAMVSRAAKMIGAARLMRLPGKEIEVFGNVADGSEFDWSSYRGKVVLVDFWASWCGPCIGELPNMKRNLASYGDKGFEIVGINLDSSRDAFEKCIEDKEITWTNLLGDPTEGGGWDHPMATYYGISAIPTAILVDQQGKVVSLRARGSELDRLLADILGPVEESTEDEEAESDGDKG